MTQLPEEGAVGGANDDPIIAAEPTLEERLGAAISDDEPEAPEAPQPEEAVEPELTPEDVADEGEAEPIAPPVSLTAEEKEAFKSWPREAQEAFTRRVGELEKGLHTKAQEAARTRAAVEQEALQTFQQLSTTYAEQLKLLAPQIPQRPSHQLQAEDPYAYAEQMDYYEYAVAQHNHVQQQLAHVAQRQAQVAQQAMTLQNQQTEALLKEHFPEYLDPEQSPKLREKLSAAAIRVGYTQDQLANVDGRDILAMREVANALEKADKYDALMKQKMEKVRSAKDLPRVSRPGVAQAPGAVANQRYQADREAMRNGDRDAAARAIARFL